MRRIFTVCLISAFVASPALAAPINLDPGTGDPGGSGPGFTWQGLNFTLQNQPGSQESANHRVQGDSNGPLNIILEEGASSEIAGNVGSAKVTYGATLDEGSKFKGGFIYGDDLSASTPAFSNMQFFFRAPDPVNQNSIATQILVGSAASNTDSPFAGITARRAGETGSVSNRDFLTNTPFGNEGRFEIETDTDGTTSSRVTMDGVSGRAMNTEDLTPGAIPASFRFTEVLLQVETFQDKDSFFNQFGETGQKFTFTSISVPAPQTALLLLTGLLGLAGIRRLRV